jgi:phosphohistidine swiveling domain-containing protein
MAVVLQEMVDARAAGVWFPFDPASGDEAALLECTLGLGGPLVGGRVAPERWQESPDGSPRKVQDLRASEVQLLAREAEAWPGEGRLLSPWVEVRKDALQVAGGIWSGRPVSSLPGPLPVLRLAEASSIMEEARRLARQREMPVEMEWAMDREGLVWWLQMRPVTGQASPDSTSTKYKFDSSVPERELVSGLCAHPGRVEGIAWEYGLPRPEGDSVILVKEELSPQDVELPASVQGMVARDGSLLSHTAIVCREFGTPCLVDAHPFPPEIRLHGRKVVLDAGAGLLLAGGAEPIAPAPVRAVVPDPPGPLLETGLCWPDSEIFCGKVPDPLRKKLARIARLPGMVSQVEVQPDLRERPLGSGLGFPIGLVFRSTHYHPAATCDMGDGFRVMSLGGVGKDELRAGIKKLVKALDLIFKRGKKVGPELERVFAEGIDALRGTQWEEPAPGLVEIGGRMEGADAAIFRDEPALWGLAERLLGETGGPSHFLDLYLPGGPDAEGPDEGGNPVLLLHSGAVELGVAFLERAMRTSREAAMREGLYDPDTIAEGLHGVDVAGLEGRRLLRGALALTNYGFVRRRMLQLRMERAFREVFGTGAELRLVSDVLHTAVRLEGDGLLHQQGVQARRPVVLGSMGESLPLVLSSAPRAISYLLQNEGKGLSNWCPHGKIYLSPELQYYDDSSARKWEKSSVVTSDPGVDGGAIGVLHAQARESLGMTLQDGGMELQGKLFPILCYRPK